MSLLESGLRARSPETNNYTSFNHSTGNYFSGLAGVDLVRDDEVARTLAIFIGIVAVVILSFRIWQLASRHLRHIHCLAATKAQQSYWSVDRSTAWTRLKRDILYAPLLKKRHNREMKLSTASNYGTLPSRLQTLLLVIYLVGNLGFCAWLDYTRPRPSLLAELRGRSGVLACVNMVPLVIFAARNNPAIPLLKLSYNDFNFAHRWLGRTIVFESIIHVLAWCGAYQLANGPTASNRAFNGTPFLQYGLTAAILMSVIAIQSISVIRHAYYESFKTLHVWLAVFILIGVYLHLELASLAALPYVRAAIILWLLERTARLARIAYVNLACKTSTIVSVEALPGEDACRLTFYLPRHIRITPGSHCYIYIPSISFWMSHPFSIAWATSDSGNSTGSGFRRSPADGSVSPSAIEEQKQGSDHHMLNQSATIFMLVAARTGFTRKMYDLAKGAGTTLHLKAFLEGPFGGVEDLSSYGTVFMFSGGVGITHHLLQIRHLLACNQAYTVATRKVVLVWSLKSADALCWIQPWMTEILEMPSRRSMLKVLIYISQATKPVTYQSPTNAVSVFSGRCSPEQILNDELPGRTGATMVSVCGPGGFADEVREATRGHMHLASIDFNEEAFTW